MINKITALILVAGSISGLAFADGSNEQEPYKFENNVESLKHYKCPEWFRDAKFGIYLHWGVYSVPERGEWYPRYLYIETGSQYRYHVKTYGHPSEFGYKDFIPMWHAENFDPDALVGLFKQAGAKYFTPCAVHHDNFDLWDSKYHEWNSVKMGPKKDLTKMWRDATLKAGLRFGVTTHLSRSYSWFNTSNQADTKGPMKGIPYDAAQGKGSGFYPANDGQSISQSAPKNPPVEWRENWKKRMTQLIDDYEPDHFYFDCAVPFLGDDESRTGMDVIAHYYNKRPEGVMCIKARKGQGLYVDGIATLDFERHKSDDVLVDAWQTDDSIGPWGYKAGAKYVESGLVIDKIVDIVSKNGNMLLNIPIKADGSLDDQATQLLKDVGHWFDVNGEAIYATRPWVISGVGDTDMDHKAQISPMTCEDIRFTRNKENTVLYATVLDWPGSKLVLKTLEGTDLSDVRSIRLLGVDGELKWTQSANGLQINMPSEPACEYAYSVRIEFNKSIVAPNAR
ncbi:alpha-L-fucosidase [Pontiella sulfatireligans]|uniref:alpha-L-fucosidase n=1 Tax=Pontiella sulfatireligans TaxID=2750658 RepID=A0A6C2UJE1_9BACT|nr:alpha-L-fucosidase [Pontiella sulfatireligans]VGO19316.1 hypothetical protein SCARR_01374 [Pontiella sulfatireligans]